MGYKYCPNCGEKVEFSMEEAFIGKSFNTFKCRKLDQKLGLCPITDDEYCPNLCDGKPLPKVWDLNTWGKIYRRFLKDAKEEYRNRNRT